jgi:cysteine-S-conjugate beta-lyase
MFNEIIDRQGTSSMKWQKYANRDIIPLWVADMDFKAPEPIINAMNAVTEHGILGYTIPPVELEDLVVERLAKLHNWQIKKEWLVWLPGLVPALTLACQSVGQVGDAVMTTIPVYGPFMKCPESADRELIKVPMKLENNRYTFDFEAIKAAITPKTKVFLLCNPYNPAGTVFSREELQQLADICLENNVVICADEIHCDLILDATKQHISIATLNQDIENQSITLLSPSKTFNIAGLGGSFAVIPNETIRARFAKLRYTNSPMLSPYAYAAMLAAYRDCSAWHQELLAYLGTNHDYVLKNINALPGFKMQPLEATYLAWIDARQTGIANIGEAFEEAGVGISDGGFYFDGQGFVRLNFGCPMLVLEDAFERIRKRFGNN